MRSTQQLIRVGHSPDPDDAFMFHALANEKIETGDYHFTHELVDIETLNQRAKTGELELTAVSLHAYAFLTDLYLICPCGASMGDDYGPMIVTKTPTTLEELPTKKIAVPGKLTTAFLTLQLCIGKSFESVLVPFDEILNAVERGEYKGQEVDAGLVIHEGQLTYGDQQLQLVVDLGKWWKRETGLPLPLGANAIRKDLGEPAIIEVTKLLKQSIEYGLEHRQEALDHALQYGRDLNPAKADKFVGMYVNDWTIDFGPVGRQAVAKLLERGFEAGILPEKIEPEFVTI